MMWCSTVSVPRASRKRKSRDERRKRACNGLDCWSVFLVTGLICAVGAVFIKELWISALVAVLGFTLLWSIRELFEQEERVQKGWFPANPKRKTTGNKRVTHADYSANR